MTYAEPKLTIGLMLYRKLSHGTEYIEVDAMVREDSKSYPRNSSYSSWDKTTMVDGLKMRGFVSKWKEEPSSFIRHPAAFHDIHMVEGGKARSMLATLTKIEKQMAKDQATEHGDAFLAFARAIGAQWVVYPAKGRISRLSYEDNDWSWWGLSDGRNLYRRVIAEASAEEDERARERVQAA